MVLVVTAKFRSIRDQVGRRVGVDVADVGSRPQMSCLDRRQLGVELGEVAVDQRRGCRPSSVAAALQRRRPAR